MARLVLLIAAGLLLYSAISVKAQEVSELFDCFYNNDSLECAKKTTDEALQKIESEITGKKNPVAFSKVIEKAGSLMIDGVNAVFNHEHNATEILNDTHARESRKKKFGKKKKLLLKLIPLFMAIKAKISLILQFISTHFQLKFFAIAVVSLIINFIRLWLEIKRSHTPAKVIYYEHAQHQHHYDTDDEHSYWKRRSNDDDETSTQLAYRAWMPKERQ
ncbi:uncharacterized protein [Chelonus insularis]|uniref:uncharacterized protein n=1 Tax=Chelonus insularis TaxID=460826 RepID=UPI00158B7CC6|nr:uncharacterized protein LOC118074337 [Chelonus insularis]